MTAQEICQRARQKKSPGGQQKHAATAEEEKEESSMEAQMQRLVSMSVTSIINQLFPRYYPTTQLA
jgi:hypothetical protein